MSETKSPTPPLPKRAKPITLAEAKRIIPDIKKFRLKPREIRFIGEYLANGGNGSAAYRAVYRCASKHSGHYAAKLLAKENVSRGIQAMIDIFLAEKKMEFTRKIINVLYCQAFYDPAMFITPKGAPAFDTWDKVPDDWRVCVEGIETKRFGKDADVAETAVKLVNRKDAMDRLARFLTLYKEEPQEVHVHMPKEKEEQLNKIFAGFVPAGLKRASNNDVTD